MLLYREVVKVTFVCVIMLTVEKVKTFKVEELKSALKARQLPQSGKKNELLDRLIEALTNEGSNSSSNTDADDSANKDAPEETAEGTEIPNETVVPKVLFSSSSETTAGATEGEESNIPATGMTAGVNEKDPSETTSGAKVEDPIVLPSESSSSSGNDTTIKVTQPVQDTLAAATVSESEKSHQDNVVSVVALETESSEATEATEAVPPASETHGTDDTKVTYHVRIDNFQRPLTDKALYTWMAEKLGHPVDTTQLWLNKIKTHCYMDFPTREAAQACIDAVTGCKVDSKHSMVLEADFTDISVAEAEESGEAKCKPGEWKAFRDAAKLAAIHGKGHKVSGGNSSSSSGGNDGGHDMMK